MDVYKIKTVSYWELRGDSPSPGRTIFVRPTKYECTRVRWKRKTEEKATDNVSTSVIEKHTQTHTHTQCTSVIGEQVNIHLFVLLKASLCTIIDKTRYQCVTDAISVLVPLIVWLGWAWPEATTLMWLSHYVTSYCVFKPYSWLIPPTQSHHCHKLI